MSRLLGHYKCMTTLHFFIGTVFRYGAAAGRSLAALMLLMIMASAFAQPDTSAMSLKPLPLKPLPLQPLSLKPVALDVGHYHAALGAISARGRDEFQFNRALALRIAESLQQRQIAIQLIGAEGDQSRLSGRTAQASEARFFLSVHHDSVQPHLLQRWEFGGQTRLFSDQHAGFSLFVSRANPDVVGSLRCASAIGRALRAAGFTPSLYHAAPIAGEFKPFADRENGVHYYDNLVVLKTARQPALLLEAGVIVNRDEELLLLTPAYQARMSEAVADGLRACLL